MSIRWPAVCVPLLALAVAFAGPGCTPEGIALIGPDGTTPAPDARDVSDPGTDRPDVRDAATTCGDAACAVPLRCCVSTCTDTNTDPYNCGFCGRHCLDDSPLSDGCRAGNCVCAGSTGPCRPGQVCCADGCRDLGSDRLDCGACGNVCAPGETCRSGACTCAAIHRACPDGTACCSAGCFDVSADVSNCGSCDAPCDTALADRCVGGECRCGDHPACNPAPAGVPCLADAAYAEERCCDGTCRQISSENCGACGAACDFPETCVTSPLALEPPCDWICQAVDGGG